MGAGVFENDTSPPLFNLGLSAKSFLTVLGPDLARDFLELALFSEETELRLKMRKKL
jgi:hypothetical protein